MAARSAAPPACIRFRIRLLEPEAPKKAGWCFFVLPREASRMLPTRGVTTVEGTLNGRPFRANAEPDGERGHWLKIPAKLRREAGAAPGDLVEVELAPAQKQLEAPVPADLRRALAASPEAHRTWKEITPAARRDWIQWITTAKQAGTRARRVRAACDMLAGGKRRVCCFDRSGVYSRGNMGAPRAAKPRA
ncbi:MAG: YdeI/OmpD-associated family protein [Pseudomonadota bacterium]